MGNDDGVIVATNEFGRWYRTLLPDGTLWAETSDPQDWYLAHTDPAVELTWQRITTENEWVDWADHPADMSPRGPGLGRLGLPCGRLPVIL